MLSRYVLGEICPMEEDLNIHDTMNYTQAETCIHTESRRNGVCLKIINKVGISHVS